MLGYTASFMYLFQTTKEPTKAGKKIWGASFMGIGSGPSAINSASLGGFAPGRIQSRDGEDGIQHLFSAGLTEIVYGHGAR